MASLNKHGDCGGLLDTLIKKELEEDDPSRSLNNEDTNDYTGELRTVILKDLCQEKIAEATEIMKPNLNRLTSELDVMAKATKINITKISLENGATTPNIAQKTNDLVDIKPDITKIKLERIDDYDSSHVSKVLDATKIKVENDLSLTQSSSFLGKHKVSEKDQDTQIARTMQSKDVTNPSLESMNNNTKFREAEKEVFTIKQEDLKLGGHAKKATEAIIQHIVGLLMKGILPTEAELTALFNNTSDIQSSEEGVSGSSPQNGKAAPELGVSEPTSINTVTSNAGSTSNSLSAISTKSNLVSIKDSNYGRPEESTTSCKSTSGHVNSKGSASCRGRRKASKSKFITLPSPSSDESMSDLGPDPPRYMLRKKSDKSLAEERLSPSEEFYSDDSDDWSPYERKNKVFTNETHRKRKKRQTLLDRLGKIQKKIHDGDYHSKPQRGQPTKLCKGTKTAPNTSNSKKIHDGDYHSSETDSVKPQRGQPTKLCEGTKTVPNTSNSKKIHDGDYHSSETDSVKPQRGRPTKLCKGTKTVPNTSNSQIQSTAQSEKNIENIKSVNTTRMLEQDTESNKVSVNKTDHLKVQKTSPRTDALKKDVKTTPKELNLIDNDIHACTKCILAFSTRLLLQRHMFRLHYDEYLRLRDEKMWEGL